MEECLWSWRSPRLIGGVLGTEGVQNRVGLEGRGEIYKRKNVKKKIKEEKKKKRKEEKEKG